MNDPAEGVIHRIEKAWTELQESYAGLSAAQLTEPGAIGEWSVKDILAHVTTWEQEALNHLPTIAAGGRPPRYARQGGIDSFNAQAAERMRALSLPDVLAQQDATHRRLVEFVRRAGKDQLSSSSRFVRRLRLDTYGHYAIHANAIRAWRKTTDI